MRAVVFRKIPVLLAAVFLLPLLMGRTVLLRPLLGTRRKGLFIVASEIV